QVDSCLFATWSDQNAHRMGPMLGNPRLDHNLEPRDLARPGAPRSDRHRQMTSTSFASTMSYLNTTVWKQRGSRALARASARRRTGSRVDYGLPFGFETVMLRSTCPIA